MLKWARRIAIFLLLGAIANVAVAWGCVIAHGEITDSGRLAEHREKSRILLLRIISKPGYGYAAVQTSWSVNSPRFTYERSATYDGGIWWPSGLPERTGGHIGYGWPMLSLSAIIAPDRGVGLESVIRTGTPVTVWGGFMLRRTEFVYPARDAMPMIFPFRPLWFGLVFNTLLFALVLALLALGPAALRRLLRIHRGQCPACAYPRGVSPICTECGEPLPGVVAK